jgi:hypothetical protein
MTSGWTDRENIFNLVSKEIFVYLSYPQKCRPVMGWYPSVCQLVL